MTAITITRKLEIDAGHRLVNHESKCSNVHGHRYVFEVECTAPDLDAIGRVIDFSVIKDELGTWLDDNWDHGFIYEAGDHLGEFMKEHSKCYAMDRAPTAENLAAHFLIVARQRMAKFGIDVVSIKLWETPNCFAIAK